MFQGLRVTKSLGMRMVEFNVYSTIVVKAIEDGMIRHLECVAMRNIKHLIDEHEVVIISHSY